MTLYTVHVTIDAQTDFEAMAVSAAFTGLIDSAGKLLVTDAEDWGEHVSLTCADAGKPAVFGEWLRSPKVVVEVPECDESSLSRIGVGKTLCRRHITARIECRTVAEELGFNGERIRGGPDYSGWVLRRRTPS